MEVETGNNNSIDWIGDMDVITNYDSNNENYLDPVHIEEKHASQIPILAATEEKEIVVEDDPSTQMYAWDMVKLKYFKGANSINRWPCRCLMKPTGYEIAWEGTDSAIAGAWIQLRINHRSNLFVLTHGVYDEKCGFANFCSIGQCIPQLRKLLHELFNQ